MSNGDNLSVSFHLVRAAVREVLVDEVIWDLWSGPYKRDCGDWRSGQEEIDITNKVRWDWHPDWGHPQWDSQMRPTVVEAAEGHHAQLLTTTTSPTPPSKWGQDPQRPPIKIWGRAG